MIEVDVAVHNSSKGYNDTHCLIMVQVEVPSTSIKYSIKYKNAKGRNKGNMIHKFITKIYLVNY